MRKKGPCENLHAFGKSYYHYYPTLLAGIARQVGIRISQIDVPNKAVSQGFRVLRAAPYRTVTRRFLHALDEDMHQFLALKP